MSIDLKHNTARFSGVGKPNMDQIATVLQRTPPEAWCGPRPKEADVLKVLGRRYLLPLILGVLLVTGAAFMAQPKAQTFDFSTAQSSVFVVCKYPSARLLSAMKDAQSRGIGVSLVTSVVPQEVVYSNIAVMEPGQLKTEGFLVDSVQWVSIR